MLSSVSGMCACLIYEAVTLGSCAGRAATPVSLSQPVLVPWALALSQAVKEALEEEQVNTGGTVFIYMQPLGRVLAKKKWNK